MRYLLRRKPSHIIRTTETHMEVKRKTREKYLWMIVGALITSLSSGLVGSATDTYDRYLAHNYAQAVRQQQAFAEAWSAAELYGLEVDRMSKEWGLYLLAIKQASHNERNPVARIFIEQGQSQLQATESARRMAEAEFAKKRLFLANAQFRLLTSFISTYEEIIRVESSLELLEHMDASSNKNQVDQYRRIADQLRTSASASFL